MRDQPEQQAPPVQRLRVRYAKRGRMRFTSHRDFSRALERALFRARVPMAYSSGFNPHPRISYAGASPTGSASEAEYLELALAEEVDPDRLGHSLDLALPDGLDVLETVVAGAGTLTDRLEASRWRSDLRGAHRGTVERAVVAFVARGEVTVQRMTKKGLRSFDCRSAVLAIRVLDDAGDAGPAHEASGSPAGGPVLETVIAHSEPTVRPDDVLAGLGETGGLRLPGVPVHRRLAQGPVRDTPDDLGDPFEPA